MKPTTVHFCRTAGPQDPKHIPVAPGFGPAESNAEAAIRKCQAMPDWLLRGEHGLIRSLTRPEAQIRMRASPALRSKRTFGLLTLRFPLRPKHKGPPSSRQPNSTPPKHAVTNLAQRVATQLGMRPLNRPSLAASLRVDLHSKPGTARDVQPPRP
jgi:hypothetical protein